MWRCHSSTSAPRAMVPMLTRWLLMMSFDSKSGTQLFVEFFSNLELGSQSVGRSSLLVFLVDVHPLIVECLEVSKDGDISGVIAFKEKRCHTPVLGVQNPGTKLSPSVLGSSLIHMMSHGTETNVTSFICNGVLYKIDK
jgi:hypothetical protein